ncbi:MAG TPA: DUF401 family protein [Bacillota bacterium]|nr:DUF401 family protein [Bacillota bacterium]
MREISAVIISIMFIPVLSKRKIPIGIAICICAVIMALLGGLGFVDFGSVITGTFFDLNKVWQLAVVAEISIIGVLMKKYGIIDEVLNYLSKVIKSRRLILMFIPALIGMLVVPGGAIMSVPLVDQLGEKSNLPKPQRAIINLICRHISIHFMPYATGFLVVSSLAPQISIYKLIGLNCVFAVLYVIVGYFLYIRKIQDDEISQNSFKWKDMASLLKYTAPIYVPVILNLILKVPFYSGMLVSLLAVFLLHPTKAFLTDALRAFNFNVLYALIGVFLIQGIIGRMESLTSALTLIFENPNTVMLGIIATSLFFGVTTGFQPTALGVILPVLVTLPISGNMLLLYCYFAYNWGFIGYFFSPLHLCQLFTCEYLKVQMTDLYKEYWKFFVSLAAVIVISYYLMAFFLL